MRVNKYKIWAIVKDNRIVKLTWDHYVTFKLLQSGKLYYVGSLCANQIPWSVTKDGKELVRIGKYGRQISPPISIEDINNSISLLEIKRQNQTI